MTGSAGTLYRRGDSFVHRAHPMTKLLYAGAMTAYSLLITQPAGLAVLAVSVCLVLGLAGVGRAFLRSVARYLVLLGLFLLIIQGIFYQGPSTILWDVGPVSFKTVGVAVTAGMILRIFTMVASFFVVILTTHPSELVQALEQAGASPKVGYLLLATLQLSPEMVERAGRIIDAQRSRGLHTDGSVFLRLRGLVPLVAPLFYGSLMSVEAKAMALTARGFFIVGRKKTWLQELDRAPWESGLRLLLVAVLIVIVVLRVAGWV